MTTTVADDIRGILAASTITDNRLDLPGTLDPADYRRVKKIIEAAGGEWNRKAGTHLWPEGVDASEAMEPVLLTGRYVDVRKEFDAFYTPPDVAAQVITAADIRPGHLVLEPSAGDGALAIPAARVTSMVNTCEIRDFFEEPDDIVGTITQKVADFLSWHPSPDYDRVVMNPPFSRRQDMAHVRHAARFLRDGGRLAAVMSPAFTFRTDRLAVEFRAWLDDHEHSIYVLPDGSFRAAGTMVRTVILTVDL